MRGDVGLVRHEHDRVAGAVQAIEERHDLDAGFRVEIPGRLVGQENRRIVDQSPGDGDALSLTAGQLVRAVVHARAQFDLVERSLGALDTVSLGDAGIDQRQLDVVQRGRARQQVEGLEDETDLLVADARQLVVVHLADLFAVEEVGALRGRVEAANQVHQRRLARARRPHDGDVFAAVDQDGHAAQGVNLLVAHLIGLPEIPGFNECHTLDM